MWSSLNNVAQLTSKATKLATNLLEAAVEEYDYVEEGDEVRAWGHGADRLALGFCTRGSDCSYSLRCCRLVMEANSMEPQGPV